MLVGFFPDASKAPPSQHLSKNAGPAPPFKRNGHLRAWRPSDPTFTESARDGNGATHRDKTESLRGGRMCLVSSGRRTLRDGAVHQLRDASHFRRCADFAYG